MKKLFTILCIALLCGGCSMTLQNAFLTHNFSNNNVDRRLLEEDYRIVKMVTGEASATYVFCIGGLSERAKNIFSYSYQDMVKNAYLQPNQAIINVTAEKRVNIFFYPLYSRQVVHTTGMVVEFTGKPSKKATSAHSTEDNIVYHIGDFYDSYDKKGIVVDVSSNGQHGKIISLKQAKGLVWSSIYENLGANSSEYGRKNCEFVPALNNYPAISWCMSKGWYLPSLMEMQNIYKNIDAINTSIKKVGGDEIHLFEQYWTSSEKSKDQAIAVQSTYYSPTDKSTYLRVVAMCEF